jgi:hypothetical protein
LIITTGCPGEQLCWSGPWTGFSARTTYTPGQMTYDLRRLRLGGRIRRLPHTNRYTLTEDGIRIAVFYTKVYNRLLVRSPPPTGPRHHPNYALRYRPSPATSTPTPSAHASRPPHKT